LTFNSPLKFDKARLLRFLVVGTPFTPNLYQCCHCIKIKNPRWDNKTNPRKPKVFMKTPYPNVGSRNPRYWDKTQGVATLISTCLCDCLFVCLTVCLSVSSDIA